MLGATQICKLLFIHDREYTERKTLSKRNETNVALEVCVKQSPDDDRVPHPGLRCQPVSPHRSLSSHSCWSSDKGERQNTQHFPRICLPNHNQETFHFVLWFWSFGFLDSNSILREEPPSSDADQMGEMNWNWWWEFLVTHFISGLPTKKNQSNWHPSTLF